MLRYKLIIKKWAPRVALVVVFLAIIAAIYATTNTTPRGNAWGVGYAHKYEATSTGGDVFSAGLNY